MDFKDGTAVTYNEEGIVLSSKTVNYKINDGSLHSVPLINRTPSKRHIFPAHHLKPQMTKKYQTATKKSCHLLTSNQYIRQYIRRKTKCKASLGLMKGIFFK